MVLPENEIMRQKIIDSGITESKLDELLSTLSNENAIYKREGVALKVAAHRLGVPLQVEIKTGVSSEGMAADETLKIAEIQTTKLTAVNINCWIVGGTTRRVPARTNPSIEMMFMSVADETGTIDATFFSNNENDTIQDFLDDNLVEGTAITLRNILVNEYNDKIGLKVGRYTEWEKHDADAHGSLCEIMDIDLTEIANIQDNTYITIGGAVIETLAEKSRRSRCVECYTVSQAPPGTRVRCRKCKKTTSTAEMPDHTFAIADATDEIAVDVAVWNDIMNLQAMNVGDEIIIRVGKINREYESISFYDLIYLQSTGKPGAVVKKLEDQMSEDAARTLPEAVFDLIGNGEFNTQYIALELDESIETIAEVINLFLEAGIMLDSGKGEYQLLLSKWVAANQSLKEEAEKKKSNTEEIAISIEEIEERDGKCLDEEKDAPIGAAPEYKELSFDFTGDDKYAKPSDEIVDNLVQHYLSVSKIMKLMTLEDLRTFSADRESSIKYQMEPLVDYLLTNTFAKYVKKGKQVKLQVMK